MKPKMMQPSRPARLFAYFLFALSVLHRLIVGVAALAILWPVAFVRRQARGTVVDRSPRVTSRQAVRRALRGSAPNVFNEGRRERRRTANRMAKRAFSGMHGRTEPVR